MNAHADLTTFAVKHVGLRSGPAREEHRVEARSDEAALELTYLGARPVPDGLRPLAHALLLQPRSRSYSFTLNLFHVETLLAEAPSVSADRLRRLAQVWTVMPHLPFLSARDLAASDWARPEGALLPPTLFTDKWIKNSEDLRQLARWVAFAATADHGDSLATYPIPALPARTLKTAFSAATRRRYSTDSHLRTFLPRLVALVNMARHFPFSLEDITLEDLKTFAELHYLPSAFYFSELMELVREERPHLAPVVLQTARKHNPAALANLFRRSEGLDLFSMPPASSSIVSRVAQGPQLLFGRQPFPIYESPNLQTVQSQPDLYLLSRLVRVLGVGPGTTCYLELASSSAPLEFRVRYALTVDASTPPFGWMEALQ